MCSSPKIPYHQQDLLPPTSQVASPGCATGLTGYKLSVLRLKNIIDNLIPHTARRVSNLKKHTVNHYLVHLILILAKVRSPLSKAKIV